MASKRQYRGRWSHIPLPLVQLLHGSECAKTAAERFFFARQLWEVNAQLLSHLVLANWQWRRNRSPSPDSSGTPSVFDWIADKARLQNQHRESIRAWRWLRALLPTLCNAGDPVAVQLRDWLSAESPSLDPQWGPGFLQLLGITSNSVTPRCLADWFESFLLACASLTDHEPAQLLQPEDWNSRTAWLRSAWLHLTQTDQFFRQHRLVFVTHLTKQADGTYRVGRLDLTGDSPRTLPCLELRTWPQEEELLPGCVYLESARTWPLDSNRSPSAASPIDHPWPALKLHPWITFDPETDEVFFLQGWLDGRQPAFLAPVSGRWLQPTAWMESAQQRLEQLARDPITAEYLRQWTAPAPSSENVAATIFPCRQSARFELLSEVASNPQAVGYRAWQVSVQRPVRLQCLLPVENRNPLPEQDQITLFSLRRLHHPHLIKVYEHGVSDNVTYIATEFVPGVSLASVMEQLKLSQRQQFPRFDEWYQALRLAWQEECRRERPLCILHTYERRLARYLLPPLASKAPVEDLAPASDPYAYLRIVIRLVADISESLYTLHQSGAVHGSVVPGRILLASEDNRPVLLEPSSFYDLSGQTGLAHTLRYLSPEKRTGAARLDPQADIYSLAVILGELLLLPPEVLVRAESLEHQLARRKIPFLAPLANYLAQCLSNDAEERPSSALDFAQFLRTFLQELPSLTQLASPAGQAAEESKATSEPSPPSSAHQSPTPPQTPPTTIPVSAHEARKHRIRQYLLPIVASVVVITSLLTGLLFALAWWLKIEPTKLLALLAQRTAPWIAPGQAENTRNPSQSTAPPNQVQNDGPSEPPSTSPPTSDTAPGVPPGSQANISPPASSNPNKPLSKPELASAPAIPQPVQAMLESLRQELQQAQELAKRHQQSYLATVQEVEQLHRQLRKSLESEKQAREESAALVLKLETLAAEYHNFRTHAQRQTDLILQTIYQRLQPLFSQETKYSFSRRMRRPVLLPLRDFVCEQCKLLESNEASPLTLATAQLIAAWLYHECGAAADAEHAYRQAFTILNQAPPEFRQRPEYKTLLYQVHSATGRFYKEQKKFAESEAAYLQALNIAESQSKEDETNQLWLAETARIHEQLGHLYRQARQLDKAEAAYQNALHLYQKLSQQGSEDVTYRLHLASTYQGLAYLAELRDQVETADRHHQQAVTTLEKLREKQPHHLECLLSLAAAVADRAMLYRDTGQVAESLNLFSRSLDLLQQAHNQSPEHVECWLLLRDAYAGRAHAYMALNRYKEALSDWEEALSCDLEHLASVRAYRAICLARLGDIERAAFEAERLSSTSQKTGSLCFNLACIHAVIAEMSAKNPQLTGADQAKLAETHASRAMQLLQQAVDQGYFQKAARVDYLQRDPDLDALRSREDFQRLVDRLRNRQ